MTRICLYGAPGAGKTSVSKALHQLVGLPLIEGDYLRKTAQSQASKQKNPFFYVGTTEAWKEFGELNE